MFARIKDWCLVESRQPMSVRGIIIFFIVMILMLIFVIQVVQGDWLPWVKEFFE